ncbi:MAG: hypothetical protein WD669_08085 [Pirellulales bacterium]
METLFLFCAIFGGSVLVAQFLLGFGSDHEHGDDGAEDAPDSVGVHADGSEGHDAHSHGDQAHHGSTWVFGVLTFRTVLIGLTFFGLTGKTATASGMAQPQSLAIAAACGLAAMYGVYFLMRGLYRLTADGTERIGQAVGEQGIVYLTIPAHNAGVGKVQVPVQNRTVEYEAMTAGEKLSTGTRVVVVGVLSSDRVVVEPVTEPARNSNV